MPAIALNAPLPRLDHHFNRSRHQRVLQAERPADRLPSTPVRPLMSAAERERVQREREMFLTRQLRRTCVHS